MTISELVWHEVWARQKSLSPRFRAIAVGTLFVIFGGGTAWAEFDPNQHDLENILYLELITGRVVIKTYPKDAPNHVARVKELVRQGFYNGLTWHRVLPEFMAQTGDPQGDGSGGSGQQMEPEFNDRHHLRGTVSMARGMEKNSADSQFFIMFMPKFALDGNYTIWGRVIDGMTSVDAIKKGSAGFHDGEVLNPDKIISISVAADVDDGLPPQPEKNPSSVPPEIPRQTPQSGGDSGYFERQIERSVQTVSNNPDTLPNYPNTHRPEPAWTPGNIPANRQTYAPQMPLPEWPIEPPQHETVFPPIPEGGYVRY